MTRVTDKVVNKMQSLKRSHIHVYIEPGGCAEFKYGFSFNYPESCISFIDNQITIWIRLEQREELEGILIDHHASLKGEYFFVAENPFVAEKCGCGISFRGKAL